MTAEVRVESGRFVNSTWRVMVEGRYWWVVIGFGDTVQTVIPADEGKSALGPAVIRGGPLYDRVDRVNRDLVRAELEHSSRATA